jgi:hypothetical protein
LERRIRDSRNKYLRPFLRTVQESKNLHLVLADAINDKKGQAGKYQFTSVGNATCAALHWKLRE